MEIKIKADDDFNDEPIVIRFTDEGLDNPNFISMFINNKEYIILVDDLFYLSTLFFKKKQDEKERN